MFRLCSLFLSYLVYTGRMSICVVVYGAFLVWLMICIIVISLSPPILQAAKAVACPVVFQVNAAPTTVSCPMGCVSELTDSGEAFSQTLNCNVSFIAI